MARHYSLLTTSLFARDVKKYTEKETRLKEIIEHAKNVLETDPYNISQGYNIRKLEGLKEGEGVFRLRLRDYRIRYDIVGSDVVLYSFRNRKEAYR